MKKKINDTIYEVVEGIRVNEDGRAYRILQGMYDNSICYNNIKAVDPDEPVVPPVDPDIPSGTTHTLSAYGTYKNISDHWTTVETGIGDDGYTDYTRVTRDSYYTAWNQHRTLPLNTLCSIGATFDTGVFNEIPEDAVITSLKIKFDMNINGNGDRDINGNVIEPYDFTDTDAKLVLTNNGMITEFAVEESDFSDRYVSIGRHELLMEREADVTYFTKASLEKMELAFQHIYNKRYNASDLYDPNFKVEVEYITYE